MGSEKPEPTDSEFSDLVSRAFAAYEAALSARDGSIFRRQDLSQATDASAVMSSDCDVVGKQSR